MIRKKHPSSERIGEASILIQAALWSLFPIITVLSYSGLQPIISLAWTTLFSCFFFFLVIIAKQSWTAIRSKKVLLPLLFIALFNGIGFYFFYFLGLTLTSPGNAAIVATFEVFFSFLLFNVLQKEALTPSHVLGMICMVISAIIIFFPTDLSLQKGDFFILLAAAVAPMGNHFQKQVRTHLKTEQILAFRTIISVPFLFLMAIMLGEQVVLPTGNTLLLVIFSGVVLFGISKMLWIEGIFRISVTKAISLSSVAPVLTLVFAYLILGETPTKVQLVAVPLAVAGVLLLTHNRALKNKY
ncbi:MAG: DMT family transporter [Pseudomonadales bacterium]|nr:DMT family transporter [Pseudomonadales bacterium]